jgi:Post-segregation antitoxin CcdA
MRINTTVPDDLGAKAKAYNLNISGILQEALERKITMLDLTANLVTLELDNRRVAFKGFKVAEGSHPGPWDACTYYVTAKGQVVTYDGRLKLMDVQGADQFAESDFVDAPARAAVLQQLGRGDDIQILDI